MVKLTALKQLDKVKCTLTNGERVELKYSPSTEEILEGVKDKPKQETDINNITTEMLDEIAKNFLPKPNTDQAFQQELVRRTFALVDLFGDDEKEAIIQSKLADQICRMFEKMRDNCMERGIQLKRERKIKARQNVNIELTIEPIERLDRQIEGMRYQYAILDNCFHICVKHLRPKVFGQTGINFGQYTQIKDMAKVRKLSNQRKKQTIDALMNDRELLTSDPKFMDQMLDVSNQEGIVEMPEDLQ